jgi:hypothetical protein
LHFRGLARVSGIHPINMPTGFQCEGQRNASLAPGVDRSGIGDQFRVEMLGFDCSRSTCSEFPQLSWAKCRKSDEGREKE